MCHAKDPYRNPGGQTPATGTEETSTRDRRIGCRDRSQSNSEVSQGETVKAKMAPLILLFMVVFIGCDNDHRPSYEELKSENARLESQLSATNEKIQQAKSDLDDLKTEIESGSCDEDAAGTKATDIETMLDEADEESN
jgi:hypothetical protein